MRLVPLVLLGLFSSSTALAGGGAGVSIDAAYAPSFKPWSVEYDAPGALSCLGGMAWGRGHNTRVGAELNMCFGRRGVTEGNIGLQAGSMYDLGHDGHYLSPYVSLGMGGLTDKTPLTGTFRSFFLYAKPTLAFGRTFKHVALETALYAMVPLNTAQWVGRGHSRGFITPSFGLQAAVMFGRYTARVDKYVEQPLAVPGPSEPPPDYIAPRYNPDDGEPPLAIPADEPPQPE